MKPEQKPFFPLFFANRELPVPKLWPFNSLANLPSVGFLSKNHRPGSSLLQFNRVLVGSTDPVNQF